jgi:predicted RNase H-like nuclease
LKILKRIASILKRICPYKVQELNSKRRNDIEFASIIEECRRLLDLNMNCKVSHVQRQANRVAHELAQTTRFNDSPQVFNYCPSHIEFIIMNEMH